ncbi:hypothetical protein ACHHYP_14791 [Achlya hypogyna]|uniref:Ankyrin repeat protein n=1 Tax=Achlya hypogyna TaxID=1202772 RepID=A0A1V9YCE0_ACHHY|nr:hypothetical protein ACHHYP_14791 [Achlya hypogyna]
MSSALRCPDLLRNIVAFQDGVHGSCAPLLALLYSVRLPCDPSSNLQSYVLDLRAAYASFHTAFLASEESLSRLCITPRASDELMYYGIVHGNVAILRHRDATGAPFLAPTVAADHDSTQLRYLKYIFETAQGEARDTTALLDPKFVRVGLCMRAMELACVGGHLELVMYLHMHKSGYVQMNLWGKAVANATAAMGHVHILAYFHAQHCRGATRTTINAAARYGQQAVVKFLLDCNLWSPNAIEWAARYGHADVVACLAGRSAVENVRLALQIAVEHGDLAIVRCISKRYPALCTWWLVASATFNYHVNLVLGGHAV